MQAEVAAEREKAVAARGEADKVGPAADGWRWGWAPKPAAEPVVAAAHGAAPPPACLPADKQAPVSLLTLSLLQMSKRVAELEALQEQVRLPTGWAPTLPALRPLRCPAATRQPRAHLIPWHHPPTHPAAGRHPGHHPGDVRAREGGAAVAPGRGGARAGGGAAQGGRGRGARAQGRRGAGGRGARDQGGAGAGGAGGCCLVGGWGRLAGLGPQGASWLCSSLRRMPPRSPFLPCPSCPRPRCPAQRAAKVEELGSELAAKEEAHQMLDKDHGAVLLRCGAEWGVSSGGIGAQQLGDAPGNPPSTSPVPPAPALSAPTAAWTS